MGSLIDASTERGGRATTALPFSARTGARPDNPRLVHGPTGDRDTPARPRVPHKRYAAPWNRNQYMREVAVLNMPALLRTMAGFFQHSAKFFFILLHRIHVIH